MTLHIPPNGLLHSTFGGLEPVDPGWMNDVDYWEGYNAAFFAANGAVYEPSRDSNVAQWVQAADRAPFADMAQALLAQVSEDIDLSDVRVVFLAHWLPDVHLGTSVTNCVMHVLGLNDAFGLAFSDRGLTAPFYALDAMAGVLAETGGKGLLLTMDQKNLLYRTPALDALPKSNSASLLVLDLTPAGRAYRGYRRHSDKRPNVLHRLAVEFEMDPDTVTFVAPAALAEMARDVRVTDPALLSAAPFAVLQGVPRDRAVICVAEDTQGYAAIAFGMETSNAH